WRREPRPASWYAGGNIRAGCARSSSRPSPPYDRSGPATVIAERRPHARGDFGPSVASAPARLPTRGGGVSHWYPRWAGALAHFEMPLTLERREIDAGDTGDFHIIERQVSHDFDLGRPIVTFDRAQVGTAPVNRHAELGASSRVGELDADMTAGDGCLQGRT